MIKHKHEVLDHNSDLVHYLSHRMQKRSHQYNLTALEQYLLQHYQYHNQPARKQKKEQLSTTASVCVIYTCL